MSEKSIDWYEGRILQLENYITESGGTVPEPDPDLPPPDKEEK